MFGEIGVEGGIAVDAGAVVSDDGFEGGEAAVVHVGGGAGEVAEAWGDELAGVGGISGDGGEAGSGIGEAVVVELVVGEERATVAVEAVGSALSGARVGFGHEQFEAALFGWGEGGAAEEGEVEFRVGGDEGEEVLFEGEGDLLRGDAGGFEGGAEAIRVFRGIR